MKTPIFLLSSLISIYLSGQSSSVLSIPLNKNIWFYPKEVRINKWISLQSSNLLHFTKSFKPGLNYPLMYDLQKGFDETDCLRDKYNNSIPLNNPITLGRFTQELALKNQLEPDILDIQKAGLKIRKGATRMIGGTISSLVGPAAGLLIAKKHPKLGYPIVVVTGALGLTLTLSGLAIISSGGSLLEYYGEEIYRDGRFKRNYPF